MAENSAQALKLAMAVEAVLEAELGFRPHFIMATEDSRDPAGNIVLVGNAPVPLAIAMLRSVLDRMEAGHVTEAVAHRGNA